MSSTDEIEINNEGVVYNKTLAKKWAEYFDTVEELDMIKQELLIESLRAKSKGQKIAGVRVVKGSSSISKPGIKKAFEQRGWPLITKPKEVEDYDAMKEKLKSANIEIPYTDKAPSASKATSRKKK